MAIFTDCNYEENLVVRLEQASQEFFSLDTGIDSVGDIVLLNSATKLLNEEINEFQKIVNLAVEGKKITPNVKNSFGDLYVPAIIKSQYENTKISTVKDIVKFVNDNPIFFRERFSNRRQIILAVSGINSNEFRTFNHQYPNTSLRLSSGPISSAEVNSLVADNGFDLNAFIGNIKTKIKDILILLEQFLSKLGIGIKIMGSFCSLVEDVFSPVKGQRDLSGNAVQYEGTLTNVLGLINSQSDQTLDNAHDLNSIIGDARNNSIGMSTNLQQAFGTLAGAFGITMNFFDPNTGQGGFISVDWDFVAIRDAIANQDPLFLTVIDETGNPLGDIDQNGVVDGNDVTALQTHINGSASSAVFGYIENILLPFLNANATEYSIFINTSGASEPDSSLGPIVSDLSTVSGKFGANGSGDFGIGDITKMSTLTGGIISSMQGLASGSKPVNIQSLFNQLSEISELASNAQSGIFNDYNDISVDYKNTVQDSLKFAEENSVTNPAKTEEISEKNKEVLEENFSAAQISAAEASKNLGPRLLNSINAVRNSIRQLAAIGVLENLEGQLTGVIDASSVQLKSKVEMFSPDTIDNGFHYNMGSSYGKMSGLIANAQHAASDQTTETMKKSVRGMLAQSSEKYRQRNKEEVEFIGLRFCKLAGEIERMYDAVTDPLKKITDSYKQTNTSLSAAGNEITSGAIRAGATRYDTSIRLQAMLDTNTLPATLTSPYITATGARSTIPIAGTFSMDLGPPLPGDFQFPSYEDARTGRGGILYAPGPASSLSGRAGFTPRSAGGGVDTNSMRLLYLLARRWGQIIRINSAYRSPASNLRAGGADTSFHMAGRAFDCSISGRSAQIQFMNLAYQVGFRGFGSYDTFTHIDTRGNNASFGNFRYYNLAGPPGAKIG